MVNFDVDPLTNTGRGEGNGLVESEQKYCTAYTSLEAEKLWFQGVIPLKSDNPEPNWVKEADVCHYQIWHGSSATLTSTDREEFEQWKRIQPRSAA
jgi:hypothetical protein